MATHSSVLAWRIPWTEEPVRLQSIALQRVGHDKQFSTASMHSAITRTGTSSSLFSPCHLNTMTMRELRRQGSNDKMLQERFTRANKKETV